MLGCVLDRSIPCALKLDLLRSLSIKLSDEVPDSELVTLFLPKRSEVVYPRQKL